MAILTVLVTSVFNRLRKADLRTARFPGNALSSTNTAAAAGPFTARNCLAGFCCWRFQQVEHQSSTLNREIVLPLNFFFLFFTFGTLFAEWPGYLLCYCYYFPHPLHRKRK